uniref:chitinase n=1 Tax=Branchiostoma floridae TaxID=7739 RepID=C3XQR1_BRAFL|eukprot:XP_002613628.1 hypothetical protein BRAFLDRAFT_93669 [Branchiostoma floridae]
MEHDHLTSRFPWLAKELVARGEFLKAGWCQNYATQSSQLFYDTSGFTGLEVTTGPPCTQFSLYPVNGTNTFLLVLLDRQTYNCDDNQPQCPCSSSWDYDFCTNRPLTPLSDPPCPRSLLDCTVMPTGMYPDPQDCTMFYQCMGDPSISQPFHMPCPPGTLFDWNLFVCTHTSVCTIFWQSDKCYRFSDDSLSNQQASSTCVSMNGHLADIQDTAQQQLIASYMNPGHDQSFWVANKISSSFCSFGAGSAASTWMYNNGSINFDICVLLNSAYGYKGTYQRCEEQHNYICESAAGPCQPNVCQHGGYCVSCFGESSIFCICPQGYSGPRCEIVDLCLPNPCPFDWTCSIQAGGIHCAGR